MENPVLSSCGRDTDVFCMCEKDHLNLLIWFCALTCCSRLMGGARDDACLIMWVSMEQPVEQQKCVVRYMGVRTERGAGFIFNCKLRQSGYQWLLMNACCNLNTEWRASESLCSHSIKISTFFDSDVVNPGWTLQTSTAEYSVLFIVQKSF